MLTCNRNSNKGQEKGIVHPGLITCEAPCQTVAARDALCAYVDACLTYVKDSHRLRCQNTVRSALPARRRPGFTSSLPSRIKAVPQGRRQINTKFFSKVCLVILHINVVAPQTFHSFLIFYFERMFPLTSVFAILTVELGHDLATSGRSERPSPLALPRRSPCQALTAHVGCRGDFQKP